MSRTLVGVVTGLVVAAALFAAGWTLRGQRAEAAERRNERVTDSTLQAITVANARARDSLEQLRVQDSVAGARATVEADSLRRAASQHAAADRVQDAELGAATTAKDSIPILTSQRDQARLSYTTLEAGFARHLIADSLHFHRDTLHFAQDILDRKEGAAREDALRALNRGLAGDLERLQDKGKFLGLIRIPGWVETTVKVGAGVYIGCRLADGCKVP